MRAMILAAGRGKRLRPLTDHTPKPLVEAGGQTLISYHLQHLAQAGFREVVINISHLGDKIKTAVGDGSQWGLQIQYSAEPENALDTGGGIRQALQWLGNTPFAVINADVFTDYPMTRLRAVKCNHAHVIMVANPAHHPQGDWGISAGRMDPDGVPRFTFSGISVYHPRFFEDTDAGRFSVIPMLVDAARQKHITAELYRGIWHDIGTSERLENLRQHLHPD